MASSGRGKIGIVGSGLIGKSWSMLFAAAGYEVKMYDVEGQQVAAALDDIKHQLESLSEAGLLRGQLSASEQRHRISAATSLGDCVTGAKYVQECVPEVLALKEKVFAEMDGLIDNVTVLGSSTSSMPASSFTGSLVHRSQCIVAHPINPPFYAPLVEVVPAPYTNPSVTDATMAIMKEIGQSPVLLKKEIEGFAVNRVQCAILNECWRLVQDDVISVADLDKVMSDGLGLRYAFIGPIETTHLNAPKGILDYCERYSGLYCNIATSFGPAPVMTPDTPLAHKMAAGITECVPLDQLESRRKWRDSMLAELYKLKKSS